MLMASSPPPPWRNSTKSAEEPQNCVRGGILPNTLKTRNLKCTLWETLIQMQFPSTWQKCLFLEQANIILIPKWNAIRLSENKTGITRWDGSSMLRSVVRWRESQFPVLHVKDPAPGRIWWHSIDWGIKKICFSFPCQVNLIVSGHPVQSCSKLLKPLRSSHGAQTNCLPRPGL